MTTFRTNLSTYKVKGIPPAAYYIPDFITAEEEEYLQKKVGESPLPKWKTVGTGRRLQYWGGNLSKTGVLLPECLPEFLTAFPNIIERIETFLDPSNEMNTKINQVLINEYQADQGISPHEDGPAFAPLVATLSLGSHTVLDLHQYLSETEPSPPMTATSTDGERSSRPIAAIPIAQLLLMPRSLLVLSSSLYTSHLHGITARVEDSVGNFANGDLLGDEALAQALQDGSWKATRGVRTSLTFRHANKVMKGGAFSMVMGAVRRQ